MCAHDSKWHCGMFLQAIIRRTVSLAGLLVLLGACSVVRPASGDVLDPFQGSPAEPQAYGKQQSSAPHAGTTATAHTDAPASGKTASPAQTSKDGITAAYIPVHRFRGKVRPANFENSGQAQAPFKDDAVSVSDDLPAPSAPLKDPCGAVEAKPLNTLGVNITAPTGKLPTDLATHCWDQINQSGTGSRCWPMFAYQWNATCFCHQPLYFEEINLERYGYQCGDRCCCCSECCLQPAASAAHFFGTVLVLPYCMAVDCPGDCVYTLGHYRPGDCNPWRWHWPPCDPLAAAAEGGVWTGLIFAIP